MESRTTTFISGIESKSGDVLVQFKGCPLACDWCPRPEDQSFEPELSRDSLLCENCGQCLSICERGAILPGGPIPALDRARCDECFICTSVCEHGGFQRIGERMSPIEAFEAALALNPHRLSLGGGEPLSRPAFSFQLLSLARKAGLQTLIRTCGFVPWEAFEQVLPVTDRISFEIKLLDDSLHRRFTGVSNALILHNVARLVATNIPLIVRVPVVPGRTDVGDNIPEIIAYARRIGAANVELFPYSPTGNTKWSSLAKLPPPLQLASHPTSPMETYRRLSKRMEAYHRFAERQFPVRSDPEKGRASF